MSAAAIQPEALAREVLEFQRRLGASIGKLAGLPPIELATAPRDEVFADGKLRLYRYRSDTRRAGQPPLLIVFALVNRPTVLDLQPDRSLIRGLLAAGVDVHLLDWGYPDRGDRHTTLADYTTGYLGRAVAHLNAEHGPVDLLGVCQGGTLSLMYASLEPKRIRRLVTMVTPVDFHTPDNLLSKWVRSVDLARLVETFGNVPGELLNATFVALMPFRLTMQKYLALVDGADDPRQLESFLRMEKWIFDSPDQAGAAFREFIGWFYQENRLAHGTVELGGRTVDLGRLAMPILNLFATQDHLVPPAAARALGRLVGSRNYREAAFEGGHIGIYVSARAGTVPPLIADWLQAR
jgi:polyhydroxyalkanoate synthase